MNGREHHQMRSFGLWLRSRRLELQLTQAALAERAGCARDVLRQFEAEAKRPSLQLAGRLADALSIPAEEREAFIQAARGNGQQRRIDPDTEVQQAAPASRRPNLPQPQTELIGRDVER